MLTTLKESIISAVSVIPAPLATVVLGALPIIELRGAIPVALDVYKLPLWYGVSLSIIGSMLPVYFILLGLEIVSTWLRQHWHLADKFFTWLFQHTQHKFASTIQTYKGWALVAIAALPIPLVGGAWTAALAAFVFGLPKYRSLLAIFIGTLISAAIVTFIVNRVGATFAIR